MKENYEHITDERFMEIRRHCDKCKCEKCKKEVNLIDDILRSRTHKVEGQQGARL